MADKEERIYIGYYKNNPCKNCGKDYCAEGTCFCDIEFARSIPVTEAIEVMAKAICREDNCLDSCAECVLGFGSTAEEKEQFCQKQIIMSRDLSASYISRAEAALNALLGVEK